MLFVQATTGSGGWPMSVWLTPDLKPFFGGTYYPPDSRYGRPGFKDILEYLARAWKTERDRVELSGNDVADQLRSINSAAASVSDPDYELFKAPFPQFRRMFDSQWGGFGHAPKFPRPAIFHYLLRFYAAEHNEEALEMTVQTLHQMASGGMHDQLGGGFHRYSVDERWFVPHFEKMLYDQAQLAISYLEAYQITRDERLATVARDILDYVLRDLRDEAGGFYSAEDADSPDPENHGHSGEGAFYIWRQREIETLLGTESAAVFCRRYGVQPEGNVEKDPQHEFTGRNILHEATTLDEAGARSGLTAALTAELLAKAKGTLFEARQGRPRPHLDRKVLTSWNGLMISAFAKAYALLDDKRYKKAAESALDFLFSKMYDEASGRLLRRFCDGEAAVHGFLDDYAFLAQAVLDVFEITFSPLHLERGIDLATRGFLAFEDRENGGFYSTPANAPDLLMRVKDDYDGAEPAGNSVATDVLLRLSRLTGDSDFEMRGARCLYAATAKLKAQPTAAPILVAAVGSWLAKPAQLVIRCEQHDVEVANLLKDGRKTFEPNGATFVVDDRSAQDLQRLAPFLKPLERNGRITIYRCENFTCSLPQVLQ